MVWMATIMLSYSVAPQSVSRLHSHAVRMPSKRCSLFYSTFCANRSFSYYQGI